MAVALVQQTNGNSGSSSTTLSCTLGVAPTTGSLLIFAMAGDKNTGALTLSGFTELYSLLQTSVSLYYWYKVSDGSETTINPSWATASAAGNTAWYGEWNDSGISGSSWVISGQASHISDNTSVNTWDTGTTGTLTNTGYGIAVDAVDSSQSVTSVSAWGNSYAITYSGTGLSGRGGVMVAEKAESSGGTTNSTFNYSGTADQNSGAIGVWAKIAAATNPVGKRVHLDAAALVRAAFW